MINSPIKNERLSDGEAALSERKLEHLIYASQLHSLQWCGESNHWGDFSQQVVLGTRWCARPEAPQRVFEGGLQRGYATVLRYGDEQ